jgi:hypothetical protein
MEFRLTYAGKLLSHRDGKPLPERSLHVHAIRKTFQQQLKVLWAEHPTLAAYKAYYGAKGQDPAKIFRQDGFNWLPLATHANGLICKVELLMLRDGRPGKALSDIDNKLKTIFDALKMAKGPQELGQGTTPGQQVPSADENPFRVLLEDDSLITHVAVTTDTLLEPVPQIAREVAARLVISVSLRPYKTSQDNLDFVS